MIVLFGVFIVLLILGMPISFSMFLSSLAYMIVYDMPLITLIQRVATGVNSFTLLAAPCFILAGAVMNTGGVTDRIFNWCNKLVGHIPGGLGHTNVFASVIFAGMSGMAFVFIMLAPCLMRKAAILSWERTNAMRISQCFATIFVCSPKPGSIQPHLSGNRTAYGQAHGNAPRAAEL